MRTERYLPRLQDRYTYFYPETNQSISRLTTLFIEDAL
jgi:hypothetical protein